jgi:hypothetical protein
MQFQLASNVGEQFADIGSAYIRSRADIYQPKGESEAWTALWTAFRDAADGTLDVPDNAADIMFYVWGTRDVWPDDETRKAVMAQLRPQWKAQMRARTAPRP